MCIIYPIIQANTEKEKEGKQKSLLRSQVLSALRSYLIFTESITKEHNTVVDESHLVAQYNSAPDSLAQHHPSPWQVTPLCWRCACQHSR